MNDLNVNKSYLNIIIYKYTQIYGHKIRKCVFTFYTSKAIFYKITYSFFSVTPAVAEMFRRTAVGLIIIKELLFVILK